MYALRIGGTAFGKDRNCVKRCRQALFRRRGPISLPPPGAYKILTAGVTRVSADPQKDPPIFCRVPPNPNRRQPERPVTAIVDASLLRNRLWLNPIRIAWHQGQRYAHTGEATVPSAGRAAFLLLLSKCIFTSQQHSHLCTSVCGAGILNLRY
jgi:hypothetical protein